MKMPVLGNIRCAMICLPSLHTPGPTQTNPNHLHLLRNYAKMLLRKASTLLLLPVHLLLLPVHLAVLLLPAVLLHSLARTRLNNVYIYIFFFFVLALSGTGLNLLHGAKFQRFLSGKSVFLNSKFQIREFHAH